MGACLGASAVRSSIQGLTHLLRVNDGRKHRHEICDREFVVLVDNNAVPGERGLRNDDIELLSILLEESSLKTAVRIAARLTGKSKNEIYQQALKLCAEEPE